MTCESCTCRTTCRAPCDRLRSVLPTTNNALTEKLCPSSELPHLPALTLAEMERDLSESTRLPRLPGISERDAALLAGRYFDGLTHRQLADRFNLTPGSCRVILTRLRHRVNTLTGSESH